MLFIIVLPGSCLGEPEFIEDGKEVYGWGGRRRLATASVTETVVSGTGMKYTITATDTQAGLLYYAQFNNECSTSGYFTCSAVAGQEQVLDANFEALMTDNGDNTYTYEYTATRPGKITINILRYAPGGIYLEWYPNQVFSGQPDEYQIYTSISQNFGHGNVFGTYSDHLSGKLYFKIKAPASATYTLTQRADDYMDMYMDGTKILDAQWDGDDQTTISMTAGTYYDFRGDYAENTGGTSFDLLWEYPGQVQETIPIEYIYYPDFVDSPIQKIVDCNDGYSKATVLGRPECVTVCGDGKEAGNEKCDDGNTTPSDGCEADCLSITPGWVCSGGSNTTSDTCTQCSSGYEQDDATNPENCITRCGDGFEAGAEKCDDGNTTPSDGCETDCLTVTPGWVCSGGSPTSSDSCTQCSAGFYQDDGSNPENCVTQCGDGLRAGTEVCDDGNTDDDDGCEADCSGIELGWICSGGSPTSADVCKECTSGFYQDDISNPQSCVSKCGDGFRVGGEICDDGNKEDGDGCSSACDKVESGYTCEGGSSMGKDECEYLINSPLSSDEKTMQGSTIGIIAASSAVQILSTLFSGGSLSSIFASLNQIQLIMLLLLLRTYIPLKVINYIRSLNMALVNLDIDWKFFILFRKFIEWFDYKQERNDYFIVGLKSGSSLINITGIFFLFLLGLSIHVALYVVYLCVKNSTKESKIIKVCSILFKVFTYSFYVILIFQGFITFCLSSFKNIYDFEIFRTGRKLNSFIISIFLFIFVIFMIIITIIIWRISTKKNQRKRICHHEFFFGLKDTKISKIFPILFLCRRFALCLLIVCLPHFNHYIWLSIYFITTTIHCFMIIWIRPFAKVKENVMEITNEIFYSFFCGFLICFHAEKHWNGFFTNLYYYMLIANNVLIFIIPLVEMTVLKVFKRYFKGEPVEPNRRIMIYEGQNQGNMKNDRNKFENNNNIKVLEEVDDSRLGFQLKQVHPKKSIHVDNNNFNELKKRMELTEFTNKSSTSKKFDDL